MYDLAIIGAGWAGFNAAQRAKTIGLKVCLIEKSHLGGTCLNSGCIPTKALIQSAKIYSYVKKLSVFGIEGTSPNANLLKIQERKLKIVEQLHLSMQFQLNGLDWIAGEAQLIGNEKIKVANQNIQAKNILIATGSKPIELAQLQFDGAKILSSNEMLNIKDIPGSLLIVGGGVIGCEFASLFSALGSKVTVVEKMPQLLPGEDKEVAKKIETAFKKRGVIVHTNTDASSFSRNDYTVILVCVGRAAQTDIPGIDKLGILVENRKIQVDEHLRTSVKNIYAAGDCTGKIMLAHYAAYQGRIAAENIAHPQNPVSAENQVVPNCIFTDPEIASVGLTEDSALAKGLEVGVRKFDFLGSGMARILDETEGFIKIIFDKKTDELVGAVIIGPRATELISLFSLALSNHLKTFNIRDTIFAHPTIAESIGETLI